MSSVPLLRFPSLAEFQLLPMAMQVVEDQLQLQTGRRFPFSLRLMPMAMETPPTTIHEQFQPREIRLNTKNFGSNKLNPI